MGNTYDRGFSQSPSAGAAPGRAQQQQSNRPAIARAPWHGRPEGPACDAAVAALYNALPEKLTLEGRVHPQTCLAAIGAIAGFAAQRALIEYLQESGDEVMQRALRTAKTRTGCEYYFGEPLNRMLIAASDAESNQRLWPILTFGAIRAGLPPSGVPDVSEMFAHVASTMVGKDEGWPSVEAQHQPRMNGKVLLEIVWPLALTSFIARPPYTKSPVALPTRHWPAIAGRVAGAVIQRMAKTVPARVALTLVMETAIYASKVKSQNDDAVAA